MRTTRRGITCTALLLLLASVLVSLAAQGAGETAQNDRKAEGKYDKYFFYDVKPVQITAEMAAKREEARKREQSTVEATRLMDLDTTRSEGAPYLDFVWLWKGSARGYAEEEHVHDFDEFIGFIGTGGQNDPRSLGGEMEVWLGGEKYSVTKSCLIYVPKGLRHCPIRFTRIDKPILFFTGALATRYSRTPTQFSDSKSAERNYAGNFSYGVNPTKTSPASLQKWAEMHKKSGSVVESTRMLDLDAVKGAPYLDFVWLWKARENAPNHSEHAHDWGEVFGFIGSGGEQDPRSLGGEIEFWIDGEKHLVTQSCLLWMPPNLRHCPMQFNRIDRPILLFTIGMTRDYTLTPSAKNP